MNNLQESFKTAQERDARWEELEKLLLDPVTNLSQKDSVTDLSQNKKKYYIGILQEKTIFNGFWTSNAYEKKEDAEKFSHGHKLIKTIEVELEE